MNLYFFDTLSPRLARGAAALALPAARALILMACIGWTGWRLHPLLANQPASSLRDAQPDLVADAAQAANRHWFGVETPPVAPQLTVLGVFAPGQGARQPGFAIARHDGGDSALLTGQRVGDWQVMTIAPEGLTLALGRARQFYPLNRAATGGAAGVSSGAEAPPLGDDE
ncbi:hypothetical protein [Paludibacterium purpuratum]|uniref:Type II secretion system protein GspC N-terminal domain-containing protein n=1 Tax=Paludibacterium purpuratum TaxID=1144873 RepID=A0A4R7AUS0_9NEIS|nr:hypothetical protein [Paludibacterium purpuratum]TDR70756.1 hypothetical protein DFP86_12132 [Paludibacterium purpuratum]